MTVMSRTRGQAGETPASLVVKTLEIDGERFAVFEWSTTTRDLSTLTPAERAVLALVVERQSNAQIATARCCSVRTVANQLASVRRKLGATSRFDLIRWFGK
jgi:DNA-binding CsgD family transcriptional regulator